MLVLVWFIYQFQETLSSVREKLNCISWKLPTVLCERMFPKKPNKYENGERSHTLINAPNLLYCLDL